MSKEEQLKKLVKQIEEKISTRRYYVKREREITEEINKLLEKGEKLKAVLNKKTKNK